MTEISLNLKDINVDKNSNKMLFSYSDLLKIYDWPKNVRIEIIDGELYQPPLENLYHHEITARLNFLLRGYAFNKKLGNVFPTPIEVVLSKQDVVLPSLFFVSRKKKEVIDKNRVMGAPELIIEVFERSKTEYRKIKKDLYEKFGVLEYWVINSKRKKIDQYSLVQENRSKPMKYLKHETYNDSDTILTIAIKDLEIKLEQVFYSTIKL